MSFRSPDFQQFLTLAEAAVRHGSGVKGPVCAAAERIFAALRVPSTEAEPTRAVRLPVCRHLETALDHVRGQPGPDGAGRISDSDGNGFGVDIQADIFDLRDCG